MSPLSKLEILISRQVVPTGQTSKWFSSMLYQTVLPLTNKILRSLASSRDL